MHARAPLRSVLTKYGANEGGLRESREGREEYVRTLCSPLPLLSMLLPFAAFCRNLVWSISDELFLPLRLRREGLRVRSHTVFILRPSFGERTIKIASEGRPK